MPAHPKSMPEWTQWWQADLPCQFSPTDATSNADYLEEFLGAAFIRRAGYPAGQVHHPILQRWRTRGAGAFLELNALAEDLRVVAGVAGIDGVLRDLKNVHTCASTWHTVHVAALLGRAPNTTLKLFYPQTDESLPDFLLTCEGKDIACEAKLLAKSGQEEAFETYAEALSRVIMDSVFTGEAIHPRVTIVCKDVDELPAVDTVASVAREGVARYSGTTLEYRSSIVNVFIDSAEKMSIGATDSRSCLILCPKSEKEDLRIHRPGAKASKQLASTSTSHLPGVLFLGVTPLQDPGYVLSLFQRRFQSGQYPGIAGVILIHAGTHMSQPRRATLDLVASSRNVHTNNPHPNFELRPVGLLAGLPTNPREETPAYRHFSHTIRVGQAPTGAFVPDLRALSPWMLSNTSPSRDDE